MITTRSDLDRGRESGVEPGTSSRSETCLMIRLAGGCKRWLPKESMGQEVASLCISLSIYLSTNSKLWAPFENKMRDIFFKKKCFVRSLNFVNHISDYTTIKPKQTSKKNTKNNDNYLFDHCYIVSNKL